MKRFLLDPSVRQSNTDGKHMISINLSLTISPVSEYTAKDLIGLYDTNGIFDDNSDL